MTLENAAEELLSGLPGYPRAAPVALPGLSEGLGRTRLSGDKQHLPNLTNLSTTSPELAVSMECACGNECTLIRNRSEGCRRQLEPAVVSVTAWMPMQPGGSLSLIHI